MKLQCFDLPFEGPDKVLAWDEALLDRTESGGPETLWFWEADRPFVVVGFGQSVEREVNLHACEAREIPVLRRCSGGGTVVQGPGCLNYGLVLRVDRDPALERIPTSNSWIMARMAQALQPLLGDQKVEVQGHTDLALGRQKFSGNAQRRRRKALLFHGTLLWGLDFDLVEELLHYPSLTPNYRENRGHTAFLRNLPIGPEVLKTAIIRAWDCMVVPNPPPDDLIQPFLRNRYSIASWHRDRTLS